LRVVKEAILLLLSDCERHVRVTLSCRNEKRRAEPRRAMWAEMG